MDRERHKFTLWGRNVFCHRNVFRGGRNVQDIAWTVLHAAELRVGDDGGAELVLAGSRVGGFERARPEDLLVVAKCGSKLVGASSRGKICMKARSGCSNYPLERVCVTLRQR